MKLKEGYKFKLAKEDDDAGLVGSQRMLDGRTEDVRKEVRFIRGRRNVTFDRR